MRFQILDVIILTIILLIGKMGQCCQNQSKFVPQFEPQQLSLKVHKKQEKQKSTEVVSASNLVEEKSKEEERFEVKVQQKVVVVQEKKPEEEPAVQEQEEEAKVQEEPIFVVEQKKDEFVDFQQYIHIFQKSVFYYHNHELDNAHTTLKELQPLKLKIKSARDLSEDEFSTKLKEVQGLLQQAKPETHLYHYDQATIDEIQQEMHDIVASQKEVDREPFNQIYNKKGLKISTRPQGKTTGQQLQSTVHMPFEDFLAVLTDVGLFQDLVPLCESSKQVGEGGRNARLGYLVFNMPIVSDRESFIRGVVYSRLQTKGDIVISVRPLNQNEMKEYKCKRNEKHVAMEFKYFLMRYTPISEKQGKMNFSFCIEKGLEVVPGFVEKLVLEKFGKDLFANLIKYSTDFKGSKWEKRVQAKPDLYSYAKKLINDRLEEVRAGGQK